MRPAILLVQLHVGGLQGELVSAGHGLAGVDRQVHDDLLHLALVGLDGVQVLSQGGDELYVLAQDAPEHLLHVSDDQVEAEDGGLQYLAAAECQELAGEGCGALSRLADLLYLISIGVVGFQPSQDEVAVADDGGELVVEVVGHAPRQPPDGVHLGRLAELLLQPPALGDVLS